MSSPWIAGLRSVALEVPDLARAEAFYTEVWRLDVAARQADALYLCGSGADHHVLALHTGAAPRIRKLSLRARDVGALEAVADATAGAGGRVLTPLAPLDEPSGGVGMTLRDGDGRLFEVVYGDVQRRVGATSPEQPVRLAHAVLNCRDIASTQRFLERALGFALSDRSRIMAFLTCNRDHHSLALGDSDNDALNHIAFLMPSLDAVMRGGGRMRDNGHPIEWGPGRHGPGNNAFNYFIDPFGVVIEYTAEVDQIDAGHRARGPQDWVWPPGRVDQWGIGTGPSARLKQAQREITFIAS